MNKTQQIKSVLDAPWKDSSVSIDLSKSSFDTCEAAGHNFTVVKKQMYIESFEGNLETYIEFPGRFATVREDTGAILGHVGANFTPLQNVDAYAFFDSIAGSSSAIYETAGIIGNGKKIWILAKLPGNIRVLNDDITDKYLLFANGHDGTFSVHIMFTPIRVVCNNTLSAAIRSAGNITRLKHTANITRAIKNVGEIISELNIYFDDFQRLADAMSDVKISDKDVEQYFHDVYNRKYLINSMESLDEEASEEQEEQKEWRALPQLMELYETGAGTDIKGVRGSLWGAFNTIVEYEDHHRTLKEGTDRVNRLWFGDSAVVKNRAAKLAEELILKA